MVTIERTDTWTMDDWDREVTIARMENNEARLLDLRRAMTPSDFFAHYGAIRQTAKRITFPKDFARHINWQTLGDERAALGCCMSVEPDHAGAVTVSLFWQYDGRDEA